MFLPPDAVLVPLMFGPLFRPFPQEWMAIYCDQMEVLEVREGCYQDPIPGIAKYFLLVLFHFIPREGLTHCDLGLLPVLRMFVGAITLRAARRTRGTCGGGLTQAATRAAAVAPPPRRARSTRLSARRRSISTFRRRASALCRFTHVFAAFPGGTNIAPVAAAATPG